MPDFQDDTSTHAGSDSGVVPSRPRNPAAVRDQLDVPVTLTGLECFLSKAPPIFMVIVGTDARLSPLRTATGSTRKIAAGLLSGRCTKMLQHSRTVARRTGTRAVRRFGEYDGAALHLERSCDCLRTG